MAGYDVVVMAQVRVTLSKPFADSAKDARVLACCDDIAHQLHVSPDDILDWKIVVAKSHGDSDREPGCAVHSKIGCPDCD